jgi:pyridoxal phosphate enzyme (YggS family)
VFDVAALRGRLDGVRDRVAHAARRAGRDPASVRLIAVSKTFSLEHIRAAIDAGQVDFGENKVQEGVSKIQQTSTHPLHWHLIGHLQSNKARKAAASFDLIHSIDTAALLQRVDEAAAAAGRQIDVLIQVDLAGETTKYGAPPEAVEAILDQAGRCRAARLTGLMTLPPATDDPEDARPYFAALRTLRDRLAARDGSDSAMLTELSMGMSHDFEVAIEEGATMVRVGSAIFGDRSGVGASET